jgi:peptidoglycan hydrolase-like protein with peptidoglycan-binding domain
MQKTDTGNAKAPVLGGGGGGGGSSGGSFVLPYVPPASTTPDILTTTPVVMSSSTSAAPTAPASKFIFLHNLALGSKGPDVLALQQYLNAQLFIVAHSGSGSPGHESSYFGRGTQLAVMKFQRYNHLTPISGFFGPKTRALINSSP